MSNDSNHATSPWQIRLFGSVEVVTPSGTVISIPGKKTGELLAYIALHPTRAHSREKLVDLIWGDSEVGDTRTRLRQELLKLRSLLASPNDDSLPILITKDSCQLAEGTIVDAVRFEEACLMASRESDTERKRDLYLEALSLYKSDLLPGYDASWILGERTRLSQIFSKAQFDLAVVQAHLKDYPGAENALSTLLKHDPLSEECHLALMRLYAEQGQPTRVRQQQQAMEIALHDGLGVAPTAGSLRLAEELREEAGRNATSAPLIGAPEWSCNAAQALQTPAAAQAGDGHLVSSQASPPHIGNSPPKTYLHLRHAAVVLVAVALAFAGYWKLRPTHTAVAHAMAKVSNGLRNQEKWVYYYKARSGEKQNSEGRAVVADASGIYVTGLVETEKEDADILTLKLSLEGKLLWADRYSSLEHDCDRAFSMCLDGKGGIFVAGETYVKPHFEDAEGWHLTLIHYDANGHVLWDRRSPMTVHTEADCIQVASDWHGGCYLGGTALQAGNQVAVVLRYNAAGRLLWHTPLHKGPRTVFGRFTINQEGEIYLCGSARTVSTQRDITDGWLISRLDQQGNILWIQTDDGPTQGGGVASRIGVDLGGNVIVAGTMSAPGGSTGLRMTVQKYSPDGLRMWHNNVSDSGPAVDVAGLSLNRSADIAIGGTEKRADGNWDVVVARFDTLGNSTESFRYALPNGYTTAILNDARLADNDELTLLGRMGRSNGSSLQGESTLFTAHCGLAGDVLSHVLFESAPHTLNLLRSSAYDVGITLTGQTSLPEGHAALMVLQY